MENEKDRVDCFNDLKQLIKLQKTCHDVETPPKMRKNLLVIAEEVDEWFRWQAWKQRVPKVILFRAALWEYMKKNG